MEEYLDRLKKQVGKQILKLRLFLNFQNTKDFYKTLNLVEIGYETFKSYEKGKNFPIFPVLQKLAEFGKVDFNYFNSERNPLDYINGQYKEETLITELKEKIKQLETEKEMLLKVVLDVKKSLG